MGEEGLGGQVVGEGGKRKELWEGGGTTDREGVRTVQVSSLHKVLRTGKNYSWFVAEQHGTACATLPFTIILWIGFFWLTQTHTDIQASFQTRTGISHEFNTRNVTKNIMRRFEPQYELANFR